MTNYRRPKSGHLGVFYNGYDYVIARSPLGAADFIALHFGERTPESARADELKMWDVLEPEQELPLLMADGHLVGLGTPGAREVTRTASFWVSVFGEGYLASAKE